MAHGSRLMADGQGGRPCPSPGARRARPWTWGAPPGNVAGPSPLGHEPWALSHEPRIIDECINQKLIGQIMPLINRILHSNHRIILWIRRVIIFCPTLVSYHIWFYSVPIIRHFSYLSMSQKDNVSILIVWKKFFYLENFKEGSHC